MDSPRAGWPSRAPRPLLTRTQINNVTAGRARRENPFFMRDLPGGRPQSGRLPSRTRVPLISRTSVLDNVMLPMVYAGLPVPERQRRARLALASVGRAEKERSLPNQLSGGQQQRVALARALANEPSLILADEPTGALDTRTSEEVMKIFQGLNRQNGITIVLITHEPDIAAHADRIVRFRDGRICEEGGRGEELAS